MKDMFNIIINEIGRVEERTNKRFDSIDIINYKTRKSKLNAFYLARKSS